MEPISAALLAFAAIKKGISLGKDLSAMSKDVSNLFAFIDGTKEAQKTGNKNDPLSDYIAYEKALDMEKQLEQIIFDTRGSKGVATFKRMREQSASRDRESRYAEIARKNKILNILSILAGISITVGGGSALIWAAIEYKP
tara:strand:- start:3860 stop:4282 length:423 start_codon:yes stop_codon:yes gene_type:complete